MTKMPRPTAALYCQCGAAWFGRSIEAFAENIEAHRQKCGPLLDARPKPGKFNARRTTVDGRTFASKAEARRYSELVLMQKAGVIRDLTLQPRYRLHTHGHKEEWATVGEYVADFDYILVATGEQVTEDVKGVRTEVYRWKARHFALEYGRPILEIRK